MATEIVVPALGESVTEATVSKWLKSAGDAVAVDEPLVELETDKITLEVPAAAAGVLGAIEVAEGRTVEVGAVLGSIEPGDGNSASAPSPPARPEASPPAASPSLSPAVRRLVDEHGLDPAAIAGTGKGGRLTKGDVLAHLAATADVPSEPAPPARSRREIRAGRRARRARADNPAAPAHRRAAQGSPEHRGHADHLQRGRHVGGDRDARAPAGRVREEARRPPRLYELLRQGGRRGAQGSAGGSMPRSTAPTSSTRTTTTSRSPSARSRVSWCRCCATPMRSPSPGSRRASPI